MIRLLCLHCGTIKLFHSVLTCLDVKSTDMLTGLRVLFTVCSIRLIFSLVLFESLRPNTFSKPCYTLPRQAEKVVQGTVPYPIMHLSIAAKTEQPFRKIMIRLSLSAAWSVAYSPTCSRLSLNCVGNTMFGKTQGIGLSVGLIIIFISSSVSNFHWYFSILHLYYYFGSLVLL